MNAKKMFSILTVFLGLFLPAACFSQPFITAFDVYDCFNRTWDDPKVQRLIAQLGPYTLGSSLDSQSFYRFSCGVELHAWKTIYAVAIDPAVYRGRMPFGLTATTTKQDLKERFGATLTNEERGFDHKKSGMRGHLNPDGTLKDLFFLVPYKFCATRAAHLSAFSSEMRQQAGESDADFDVRLRNEEARLWESLNRNEEMLVALEQEHVEYQETPLSEKGYTIHRHQPHEDMIRLKLASGQNVWLFTERKQLRHLRDKFPHAILIYRRTAILPGCEDTDEFMVIKMRVDGIEYHALALWDIGFSK